MECYTISSLLVDKSILGFPNQIPKGAIKETHNSLITWATVGGIRLTPQINVELTIWDNPKSFDKAIFTVLRHLLQLGRIWTGEWRPCPY